MAISTRRRSSGRREGTGVTSNDRRAQGIRRGAPWIAVGTVLLLLAASLGSRAVVLRVPGGERLPDARPYATLSIVLDLTDKPSYAPRFITAAPGDAISIELNNTGLQPHSFTLSSVSNLTIPRTDTPTELNATFHAHLPTVNVSAPAGTSDRYANFTVPATDGSDSFEFVSLIPYQFQAGMWGFLNISSTSPPYPLQDNTTNSFSFQPNVLPIPTTVHFPLRVKIDVTNLGTLGHTFTVVPQAGTNISTIGYFHTNAPLVNISVNATTGTPNIGVFTIPAKGVYEYVCTVQGHFQNGMFGYIYAGVPPPPAPPAPSTAIVETGLLAGSAVLLGIGVLIVVLATVAGRLTRTR